MRLGLVLTLLLALASTRSLAETTICEGSSCVRSSGGDVRKLSDEEARRHLRGRMRDRIEVLECEHAKDPSRCLLLRRTLAEQFD